MDSVFRIEIPIETVDKTDTGSLKELESILQKVFNLVKEGKASSSGVFDALQQGAEHAKSALSGMEEATDKVADGYEKAGQAASQAASQQAQAASTAENSVEGIGDAAEDAADAFEDIGDAADDAGKAAGDAGRDADTALKGAGDSADKFSQRVLKSAQQLRQAFAEKFQLVMQAVDKASPAIKNIQQTIKGIAGKAWKVTVKIADFVTAPFRKILGLLTSPITMAMSVAGIGMGATDFVDTFTEFKAGMSNVKALSGATDEQFVQLTKTAQDLGATTKFTAAEASEGMQYLAMAGWDTNEIIAAMPGLLQLAAAGATDLGTASDIVSDVMTAMGMGADEATRAADVFAKTATSTNTTIANMGETLKYAAPIAHSFGLSLEEVSTVTGMMANAGVKGSQAGTAIRSALLAMASPTTEAQKAMKKLGLSFADSQGKMKDMKTIVKDLVGAFGGLSEQDQLAYADAIFGKMASSAWLGVINQGSTAFDQLYESILNSQGAAQAMADTQLDNLAGDMTLLQSAADGMKISLMDKLDPYLRAGVQWITAQIPAITEMAGNLIDNVIQKAGQLKDHIASVFDSSEFQNADTFAEKIMIAWDKIIAEPFSDWWNGSGRDSILGIVQSVGENLGQTYHGIIAGAIAALKGEEVDADAMNLTGLAKAGAEAAKMFVSSFMEAFDLSGLFGDLPGMLKAAFVGFAGMKMGGVGMSLARDIGTIKIAFKGVAGAAKPAETALGGLGGVASKTGGIFAGLKSLISAVPGWGWVVAGAIAAVAVGVTLYNKHLQKQKEELWGLGDAVAEAQSDFQETAQNVNKTISGLDELNRQRHEIEYKINVARYGLTDEQIAGMQARIDQIDEEEKELLINITQGGNITAEEAVSVATQLAQIESDQTFLLASIITVGNTEKGKEVYDLLQQYKLAEFDPDKKAKITAQIMASCNPEKAEETLGLLEQYNNAELSPFEMAMVAAQITANCGGNTDATALLGLLEKYKNAKLTGQDIDIEAELNAICGNPALTAMYLPMFEKYAELESNEAEIKADLDASGVTEDEIAMLEKLAGLINERDTLSLAIEAGNMSPEELAELEAQYDAVLSKITELSGGAVDARNMEGEAIDANIARLQQQLGIEKEIARLRQESALIDLEGKMPEVIKGEQESRQHEAEIQSQIDTANALPNQALQLQADYLELENQRKRNRAAMDDYEYMEYMTGEGGYIEKAKGMVQQYETLTGADEHTTESTVSAVDSTMLNNLLGGGEGGLDKYYTQNGGFAAALDDYITENGAQVEALQRDLANQQAETARYQAERLQYYSGTESLQTAEAFKGTEYEGMNLADIASHYSEFSNNPQMVAAFESAVSSLDALNLDLVEKGYMGADEVTTVDQINKIKDASFAKTKAEETGAGEGGTTPATPAVDVEQAYSTLATQNTMSGGDTKFTRDLAANTASYQEAINSGDTEAANKALQERTQIITDQQVAIRQGIEGVQQYNTQIAEQKTQIAEAQQAYEAKDYEGTLEAMTQLQQAQREALATGGSEGAAAFEGSAEAASALEGINTQLESLGIEKIESLSQLGAAMEQVSAAQSGDMSAITQLQEGLAGLEEGRIDLIVQTANALDSLTWNMNNINGDANLDSALKIDEGTVGNVENMQLALGNAAGAADGTAGSFDTASSAANGVRDSVSNAAAALKEIEGTYEVRLNYIFNQPQLPSLPAGAVKQNAKGGIYDGAMLSVVAEDGPEAIIPLGAKRRDRGLALWEQAGRMLGVDEYAEGGIMEPYADAFAELPDEVWSEDDGGSSPSQESTGNVGGNTINITVEVSPSYEIEGGGSPDEVMDVLRSKQGELAELFGSAIADQLEDIFSNMV